ncbi:MAG: hypothetical protein AAGI37_10615 [Planctomycetota bacterium]
MRYACFTFGFLLCTAQLGCSTTPADQPQPARLTFSEDRYPAVYEAAVETLRANGYRIARSDYRFGTITTFPKQAATSAEFWVDDATTYAQRRSDTYNAQQRTVTVQVEQREADAGFSLSVRVEVQRLQRPERYLTHSAGPQISAAYTDVPMHLKDRGIDGPYAYTIERDPLLERRLLDAIKNTATNNRDAAVEMLTPEDLSALPKTAEEQIALAQQMRKDAISLNTKDRHFFLAQAVLLLQDVVIDNPDLQDAEIELVTAMLELACHDPLTERQRAAEPELVTLDRFQRGQDFTNLLDLLDEMKQEYPENEEIAELHRRAVADYEAFEKLVSGN